MRLLHNPRCSKSRGCLQLLEERGLTPEVVRYLDDTPSRSELEWLWQRLGPDMVRQGESLYKQLRLSEATPEELLEAMTEHPILIERPIVILGDKAIVARPPEKALELLMERQ